MATILQIFDRYFIRVHEDNSWDEIYNPHEATVFNSKKKALEWAENETNMSEYITAIVGKNIQKTWDEFDEWVKNGMVRRHFETLNFEFNVMYDPEKHSAMDVLNWNYNSTLYGDDLMVQQEVYSSWCHTMWDHFDFLHAFEAYHSFDYTEMYISFEIKVARNAKWQDFKKEMDLMLDNFEFNFFDDDGGLIISIFDHDLCETRNMVLIMHDRDNDVWSIDNTRGFSLGTLDERKTLKECFHEIRANYWYDHESDWDDEDNYLY